MHILLKQIFLSLILVVCVAQLHAQNKWELAKDKNGIKVYTSKEGTSKFKSIKVEAVLTGTLENLHHILSDAATNKDWIYATKESYIIKKISSNEAISYTETMLPWPASNRDIPINIIINLDRNNNSMQVSAKGVPNAIPIKKGIVRIPYFNSSWNVKFDGKNKLHIKYFLEMDPGGLVPAWITNLFIAKGPYETFNNLSAKLN